MVIGGFARAVLMTGLPAGSVGRRHKALFTLPYSDDVTCNTGRKLSVILHESVTSNSLVYVLIVVCYWPCLLLMFFQRLISLFVDHRDLFNVHR